MSLEIRVEGICDLRQNNDGYATTTTIIAEGTLVGIDDKTRAIYSTARWAELFKSTRTEVKGVELEIENARGKQKLTFSAQIPSVDKEAIIGQEVRYVRSNWTSPMEGTLNEYELHIKTGKLAGQTLKGKDFA